MSKTLISTVCITILFAGTAALVAEPPSSVVVFSEAGFPAADSASPSPEQLEKILPAARLVSGEQLGTLLDTTTTRLLVLPYGSAFPEKAWPEIYRFLHRGGNLLVLGGRPFTRSAYRDAAGWKLRDYSVRFTRPLMIDQYQVTPGSEELEFQTNPDVTLQLPRFAWKRAFSPVIRLSMVDLYKRGGSAGAIDARLDALAWGVKDHRKLAAPALQIDHLRNGFDGGRWIFLNAELTPEFYSSAQAPDLIRALAEVAMQGSQEFTVRPVLPLYLHGEPVELEVLWHSAEPPLGPLTVKIATFPEQQPSSRSLATITLPSSQPLVLPAPNDKGLWIIEAQLLDGDKVRAIYHSGFWIRDEAYLRSGPRLTVNRDFFELDGHPLAVVGTTYMSSEVQRLYFEHPNVYVWDRDLAQIHEAGLNMIRTGWWTGWDKFCDENGEPYERTLRTVEAYLMTARKNGLPVQFNFFAFLPEVLGGVNPYLDPEAVRKQQTLIASVVGRFHDVPSLAWDFINEPSISQYVWKMRPNGDPIELRKWNDWLSKRYPDRAALAAAWNLPASEVTGAVSLPEEIEFTPRGMYVGHNSLKVYDFFLFAQDTFSDWVQSMRSTVRSTGSRQLITVGQDEGGIQDRLSPAFWGEFVDFTTNHSWWQNDFVLWDSLLAKQPGQPLLIQETGLQRELNLDETARRTPESEAALLERKVAISFIQGSGAVEWLWNTNSYMTEGNETPIGAIRTDATEKPEATVMRNFAGFAKSLHEHLRNPQQYSIAIITSQASQFSVEADLQLEAQRKVVRALAYYSRLAPYAIAENQIEKLGSPKLAILPSPQALTETAWRSLLKYVTEGGNLLVTGPVDRDEHWHSTMRAAELKLDAQTEPLTWHSAALRLNDRTLPLSFDQQKQNLLDALRFNDGSTFKEVPYGKGRIFWAAYPVELSEGSQAAADLYTYVSARLGIRPMFELQSALPSGVLVYPVALEDSILYVMTSENADDTKLDLRDNLTGVRLTFQLPAQHAALALIGKHEKAILAKYGF
ncbi:MAG TPA: hypothetical protein VK738_10515 [Terriglobales bacterium]|nr:hypothetical protein [Terriglobales bacterium]